jgi:hypothetical protein
MKTVRVERVAAFGQAGNAGKIKPNACKETVAFHRPKK